jgi:hypothetical protein
MAISKKIAKRFPRPRRKGAKTPERKETHMRTQEGIKLN